MLHQRGAITSYCALQQPRGAGLNDTNQEISKLAKSLWGLAGSGNVFTNMTAAEALKAVDLALNLEFTFSRNDAAIYYTQRTDGSEDVFFVNNGLREQVGVLLSLRGQGYPKILNPTTGETADFVISSRSGPRTNLAYNFNPPESIVVVMRRKASKSLHSVSKDDHQLLAATPFEFFVATPHQNISSSFTVTLWAKPEVAQFGTSNYIIYPTSSYGDGHASMSLSLGTNGIQIGEATTSSPKTVIGLNETANNFAVSGWTHFAIVYENDTLSLYVNGEMISKGTKSSNIVHPGLGQPDAPARMPKRFDGDLAGLEVHAEPLKAAEIKALFEQGLPQPNSPSPIELRGSDKALFRRGGNTRFLLVVRRPALRCLLFQLSPSMAAGRFRFLLIACPRSAARSQLNCLSSNL